MPSQFKFKAALLTYSQVDNDTAAAFLSPKEAHFNHVASALRTPVVYRLGRELHGDGGTHFHVFVSFEQRVSFETSAPSISTLLTQTSNRFHAHLISLSTMPERMTTSFMNTEIDLENLELLLQDVNGYTATLFLLKLKKDFLTLCGRGLQEITCFILEQSPDLQTRTTLPRRPLILRRPLRRTESGESLTGMVNQASEESWDEDA